MTNKSKLSVAALFSAAVLGGAFATSTVFADDAAPVDQNKNGAPATVSGNTATRTETGHAYVTFTKNGSNPIHDPSDPGSTPTGNPSDPTGETGSLTLDAIPFSLNFGTQETTGQAQTVQLLASDGKDYHNGGDGSAADARAISPNGDKTSDYANGVKKDGNEVKRVIFTQVTNLSSSKDIAWTLSAKLSGFYQTGATNDPANVKDDATANTENAMPGAYITMNNGINVIDQTVNNAETWVPAQQAAATPITLTAGGDSQTIVPSTKQKGAFQQQWNVGDVTLTVPNGAPTGSYEANIDWDLAATPADQLDDSNLAAAPANNGGASSASSNSNSASAPSASSVSASSTSAK